MKFLFHFFLMQWRWLLLVFGALAVFAALFITIVLPAWKTPENRTYTSKYGYAELKRKTGTPFAVQTGVARIRVIEQKLLGEGLMSSRTILVPVIPTAKVKEVLVNPGDYVEAGALLARLDDSRAQLKRESNELALETARSELERVRIGSAYILAQERPERDEINLKSALQSLELLQEKLSAYEELAELGANSKLKMLELKQDMVEAQSQVYQSRYQLETAEMGAKQSLKIAQNAVREAELALEHRNKELEDYAIHAPASGIIERVLIYPGEYNQDTGRAAFVLASDLWFEAHFDQSAINQLTEGDAAELFLEAFPGQPLEGIISKIIPIVTYNLGGPETNRPIRPRGTGAPEWPATFKTWIRFDNAQQSVRLVPGLTGFARIQNRKRVLAVPKNAVVSYSGGYGMVYVVQGESRELRKVKTGISDRSYVEIREGLNAGDVVITQGHEVLEPEDKIDIKESE